VRKSSLAPRGNASQPTITAASFEKLTSVNERPVRLCILKIAGQQLADGAPPGWEKPMIKDVMVCLEGTAADDVRLAAVEIIAGLFNSHVIGLFLNTVPSTVAVDPNGTGATLLDKAREFGDGVERELAERLTWLNRPTEIHRIDVLAEDIAFQKKTGLLRGQSPYSTGESALRASVRRFEQAPIDRDMLAVIASLSETPGEY